VQETQGLTAAICRAPNRSLLGMARRAMSGESQCRTPGKGTKSYLRIPLAEPSQTTTPDCTCVS